MITYLSLKGFKSFASIKLDIRGAYGEPKPIAFIYGENGSGKSNLMSSIDFLRSTLDTLSNDIARTDLSKERLELLETLPETIREDVILKILGNLNLSSLIKGFKMIDFAGPMSLEFGFRLEGYDGNYLMEFDENKIIKEKLRYRINERQGILFSLDQKTRSLSPSIFHSMDYRGELQNNIKKYWGKHTFMAILFNELNSKNERYFADNLGENLLKVMAWFDSISYLCKHPKGETGKFRSPVKEFVSLESGTVERKEDSNLKVVENILNTFFTQLYSDIKKAFYKFKPSDEGFSYSLYFSKLIDGKNIEIPVSLESTGTRKLLHVFPILFSAVAGETVFIDEIDNGIHDLLIKTIIELLGESIDGQLIATTHNTLLLENLPPENVYMIIIDPHGNKEIVCVVDFEKRTQRTNNMRKRYLEGDYDGIPYPGYFDFKELVEEAEMVFDNREIAEKPL